MAKISLSLKNTLLIVKSKSKGQILLWRYLHGKQLVQSRVTISEVAVDRQDPMVLQRKCGHTLHALRDNWTRGMQLVDTSGQPSAAGRAQDRKSSPVKDRRSTTVLRTDSLVNISKSKRDKAIVTNKRE